MEPIHVQMSNYYSTQGGMSCQISHSHDADLIVLLHCPINAEIIVVDHHPDLRILFLW